MHMHPTGMAENKRKRERERARYTYKEQGQIDRKVTEEIKKQTMQIQCTCGMVG